MSATISAPASGCWLTRLCSGRPHQIIAGDTTYLRRWFLIPRNRWLNVYLHHFVGSDDPIALHDHPWWFGSLILAGSYLEISQDTAQLRGPGTAALRRPAHRHRIQLRANPDGTERGCWTVVVTGPRVRQWGFWCPSPTGDAARFLPWQQFGEDACSSSAPTSHTAKEATR
ncbi:MAG: hypothetical protein ACLP9Y_29690 [Mycobacterium sp.]